MGNSDSSCWRTTSAASLQNGVDQKQVASQEQFKDAPCVMTTKCGAEGLRDLGFEYRLVRCQFHRVDTNESCDDKTENTTTSTTVCFDCATRLFHVESGTMIDADNRNEFLPDGRLFDEACRVCQEMVQEQIQKMFSLKFITICNDPTLGEPVRALVDEDFTAQHAMKKPTLLIITGKGKSRAGIISVKQVLISGIEVGSAMFHLVQAKQRGFSVLLLDPNARGVPNGMDTVSRSITSLFSSCANHRGPLYVLAHSAAGGYLVRYLLLGPARQTLLQNLRALVFTDSTHNLQWTRDDPRLFSLLQSHKCLYIRNTSVRESDIFQDGKDRMLGDEIPHDVWWQRRFGTLRTVWAGTTEHSLLCWEGRYLIWEFYDDCCTRLDAAKEK